MAKTQGVYQDSKGRWYFKVRTRRDPLTGRWEQVTRRGFATATDASRARRRFLEEGDRGGSQPSGTARTTTVSALVDMYLEEAETSGRLAAKTLFDYRHFADHYIRPWIGELRLVDVTPETIAAWQSKLLAEGSTKTGRALSPNTVRLARAPLNGAYKLALSRGLVRDNPLSGVALPPRRRSLPKHWSPEQARDFLTLSEGDRHWPIWVFLLGAGLRIGELVALRWPNVDLQAGKVRINEFVSALGYNVVDSPGKSRDAVRTVDIDVHLAEVLRLQAGQQADEAATRSGADSDGAATGHVFTTPGGEPYHPQYLSKLLVRMAAECGLPRLSAHGLRHTSATLMLSEGVPPKVAAERLGHADATLFNNLYSHVTPTMQREAAAKLGAALLAQDRPGAPKDK